MGAVGVKDDASTVDDFLVTLNLCYYLLLHLHRRKRNLEFAEL